MKRSERDLTRATDIEGRWRVEEIFDPGDTGSPFHIDARSIGDAVKALRESGRGGRYFLLIDHEGNQWDELIQ